MSKPVLINMRTGIRHRRTLALAFTLFTLVLAACLVVALFFRPKDQLTESAKSKLRSIPLYAGATQAIWADTDTPGGTLSHDMAFCSIECASVDYEVQAPPEQILRFYEQWAAGAHWWHRGSIAFSTERTYYYGPLEFKRWYIDLDVFPWLRARYDMRQDYLLDVRVGSGSRGAARVNLLLHRRRPMPGDTPIPSPPTPPPTAPVQVVPREMDTQVPNAPVPVPTTR